MIAPHVSPSQIATWRGCQRKWWYSRNRPRTSNKWAAFGTRTHAILEGWLTHHTLPAEDTPERACAIAGLPLLPMPRTVWCEVPIDFTFENVHYVGFTDVLGWDQVVALVLDHKTCGSFAYAHTPETLLDDPQRIIYSHSACMRFGAQWARAQWIYYQRKPPRAQPVELLEDADTIAARFIDLHRRDGLPIFHHALAKTPVEAFPRSLDHCSAYGGCPYAVECLAGVSPIALAANSLKGQKMDLATHLQQNAAGQPPAIAPAETRPELTADYAQAIGMNVANADQMIAFFRLTPDEVGALRARFAPPPAVPVAPVLPVTPANPTPPAVPVAPAADVSLMQRATQASEAVLAQGGTAEQARAAYEQVLSPAAMPGFADPRPPEQQAPKKRRTRSDKGQPRGGAKPVIDTTATEKAPPTDDEIALKIGRLMLQILELAS